MRIEKEKHKVNIVCQNGLSMKGFVHINPGERILDFINDSRESFIAVTEAEFYDTKETHFFVSESKCLAKKESIILNKSAINCIEEV